MKTFKQEIKEITGKAINRIEWVYNVGYENVGDDDELYPLYIALQVKFMDDTYISITGDTYCENPNNAIATIISYIEVCNSDYSEMPCTVDTNELFSVMYDYLLSYGDSLDKEESEHVYFEYL